jgi:hypothetical protein
MVKDGKMGKGYRRWLVKVIQKDNGDRSTYYKGWNMDKGVDGWMVKV